MVMKITFEQAWTDISQARKYREEELEGRARVCARRGVGKAIRAYFSDVGASDTEGNILLLIPKMLERSEISSSAREYAGHFMLAVNTNHELPDGIDLILEAEKIILELEHLSQRENTRSRPMPETQNTKIKMYGTNWCSDTRRAKAVFDRNQIDYEYIDIDKDADGRAFVQSANNGMRSVPTIVFSDGSILVEPSNAELESKLGL